MSDILIKGMEMPKSCNACMFDLYGLCLINKNIEGKDELTHSCPLVPVPKHGRLIDADAFAAEMKARQTEAYKWLREAKDHDTAVRADAVISFLCEVKLTLDSAPTVRGAEEGET